MKFFKIGFIRDKDQGFTLVEILVSITILLAGMVGIATMLPIINERIEVAEMEAKALELAKHGMEKARSLSYENLNDVNLNVSCSATGTSYEDYGCIKNYPEFKRVYTVTMATDSEGNPLRNVKMVTVEVSFRLKMNVDQSKIQEKTISLVDYIGEAFKMR